MVSSPDPLPSLDELQREIDQARGSEKQDSMSAGSMAGAMRLSMELLAGVAVGGVLGFFLDRWLGTSPLLFIACFFLGAAAGYRNLTRAMKKMDQDNAKQDL